MGDLLMSAFIYPSTPFGNPSSFTLIGFDESGNPGADDGAILQEDEGILLQEDGFYLLQEG